MNRSIKKFHDRNLFPPTLSFYLNISQLLKIKFFFPAPVQHFSLSFNAVYRLKATANKIMIIAPEGTSNFTTVGENYFYNLILDKIIPLGP